MPKQETPAKKRSKDLIEVQEVQKEFAAIAGHIQERPWHYAVGGIVILLCVVAGMLYMSSSAASTREATTRLAMAIAEDDLDARSTRLQEITGLSSGVQPETLYLAGEIAFQKRAYPEAREAFETLRQKFPNATQTPDAVEGLGSILEAEGTDYAAAIAQYEEVMNKWPESFAALRQPLNIARCLEAQGDIQGAIARYREQTEMFPESNAAKKAQSALDRLEDKDTAPADEVTEPAPEAPATVTEPAVSEETPDLTLQIPAPDDGMLGTEETETSGLKPEVLTIPEAPVEPVAPVETTPVEPVAPEETPPTEEAPEAAPAS